MTTGQAQRVSRGVGLAAAAGGLLLAVAAGGPGPRLAAEEGKKALPADITAGVSACVHCHSGADRGDARGFVKDYGSNQFVRLNESATWQGQDPHSRAHEVLKGDLGRAMGRNLNLDVTREAACLTCHAVDLTPTTAELPAKQFYTKNGVSCNGCHGLQEKWQSRHYRESADGTTIPWRTATPTEKAAAGMADLRNPVVKAKLCVSCHVGSPVEGKVVSHEFYAAGHPPLPPFELVTYLEGEPRHWGYPSELKYFKSVAADKTWDTYRFHPADKEAYLTRHVAAGVVAASRAEADLLLAAAADALKPDGEAIDYARFDCYACHHDLRHPSDRQQRGYADGKPGRPTLRASAGALAGVVAAHAEGADADEPAGPDVAALRAKAAGFQASWTALRRAAVARPFGDPELVAAAAGKHAAWCDGFLEIQYDAKTPLYTPAAAKRLATMLGAAAVSDRSVADPESAVAFNWAYLAVAREAGVALPTEPLARVGAVVPLAVRAAPFTRTADGGTDPEPETARFADRMKQINGYKAADFRTRFTDLLPK